MARRTLHLDVGSRDGLGGPLTVAVDLHRPERLAARPVLYFMIPGGGVTRRYFDLDGGPGAAFSFARAMGAAGHVVAAPDWVGVGESSRPDDGFALTAQVEAALMHRAFLALRALTVEGVALGSLPVVGGGHSAGAMLAILQQAAFGDFDAMALLCFGTAGLPQYLTPEHVAALAEPDGGRSRIVELARTRFGQAYVEVSERQDDSAASRALRAAHDVLVAPVGLLAMTPGNVRPELASVAKPVFLAVGDRDMTGPPHLLGADYVACPDFTRYVVPGSGHHVFVAEGAADLFARLADWGTVVTAGADAMTEAERGPR